MFKMSTSKNIQEVDPEEEKQDTNWNMYVGIGLFAALTLGITYYAIKTKQSKGPQYLHGRTMVNASDFDENEEVEHFLLRGKKKLQEYWLYTVAMFEQINTMMKQPETPMADQQLVQESYDEMTKQDDENIW